MQKLQLPAYPFRISEEKGKKQIFDEIRKKFVSLTPEEWVRQHFIKYLSVFLHYPETIIGVEVPLKVNRLPKRCDILIYDGYGNPFLLVECKAPSVEINTKVFEQAGIYDMALNVEYVVLTNGLKHYCVKVNKNTRKLEILKQIPEYGK